MGILLRNGRFFLKKKNEASILRNMVNQIKIVKKAEGRNKLNISCGVRGFWKFLFHPPKIGILTNSPKFSN